MLVCNLNLILQSICVTAAAFGIVCAIVLFVEALDYGSEGSAIAMVFVFIFCLFLLLVEVHVFNFLKYFAFLLTVWGKAVMYIFLGFFLYAHTSLGLAAAIIFWVFFVLFIVMVLLGAQTAPPLTQRNNPPQFETHSEKYFQDSELPAQQRREDAPRDQTEISSQAA
jgi:membrane protein insertase Oxa1/YidC/SpoIIIJ